MGVRKVCFWKGKGWEDGEKEGGCCGFGGRPWEQPCVRLCQLGLRAAVAWGGALAIGCTKLIIRSVEGRASGHGTGGLLVGVGTL